MARRRLRGWATGAVASGMAAMVIVMASYRLSWLDSNASSSRAELLHVGALTAQEEVTAVTEDKSLIVLYLAVRHFGELRMDASWVDDDKRYTIPTHKGMFQE
eukprot:766443-Hanusia_phi.AAC.2